jgi:hypothetical protein
MNLKIGEQRKYEGVSASEETIIICAQFHTTSNIKSKLQVANAFYGCLASTKRYHELGIKQKNPLHDPSDPYTFVPEFEYGFIIVCRGENNEWKWLIFTRCTTQFLILYKQKLHKATFKRLKETGVPHYSIWTYEEYEISTLAHRIRKLFTVILSYGIMYENRDFQDGKYIIIDTIDRLERLFFMQISLLS